MLSHLLSFFPFQPYTGDVMRLCRKCRESLAELVSRHAPRAVRHHYFPKKYDDLVHSKIENIESYWNSWGHYFTLSDDIKKSGTIKSKRLGKFEH
jgi:hypothetical protein